MVEIALGSRHFFLCSKSLQKDKKWKQNCKVSDLKGMKDLLKLRKETSSVNKLEGKWLDLERQQFDKTGK